MKQNEHDEVLDLLRAAHNETIDAAHYTAVRSRVLAEIERTRSPWRRLAWISGVGVAMAGVLIGIVVTRQPVTPILPMPTVAIGRPPAPAIDRIVIAPAPPPRHTVASAARHREPLTIKLQTADPNIVIYWIAD